MTRWFLKRVKNSIKSNMGIVILIVFVVLYQGFKYCKERIYLHTSDTIVCINYHSLQYLFRPPYKYYAVGTKSAYKIRKKTIIEYFGEEVTQQKIQDSDNTDSWGVELYYSGGEDYNFYDSDTLRTSYGNQYKIVYDDYVWGVEDITTIEKQQKIVQITEELCNGKMPEESSGGERVIMQYQLIHENDIWYAITGNSATGKILMRVSDEGKLIKIMKITEGYINGDSFYVYGH